MTIKIDAPVTSAENDDGSYYKARVIREGDWRKLMAVVRAAEEEDKNGDKYLDALSLAVIALRKHLEKRK